MSFDKAIEFEKEKRKPYRKSKRFDRSCRNHGSCSHCEEDRTHFDKKARWSADESIDEWEEEGYQHERELHYEYEEKAWQRESDNIMYNNSMVEEKTDKEENDKYRE